MGKFNGKDADVWMRALKPHTYEHKPKDVGDIYQAHEEMVETIEILGMAVREPAPRRAVVPADAVPVTDDVTTTTPQPAPAEHVTPEAPVTVPAPRRRRTS